MITGEIKNKIDSIWDDFFSAGMSEYLTVIEQFSYLMFIHSLDEVENETEQYEKFSGEKKEHIFPADKQNYRWHIFKTFEETELFNLMDKEIFPFIKTINGNEESAFARYMKDAAFSIPSPQTLKAVITKLDELFQYADMAMYEVKKSGKNAVYFFEQLMQEKFAERICLENKLTNAIDTSCLELYFQPQVDITTKTLRGFEALVRWYDSELGWIKPDQFIPMAEESKLIIPLGDWVLDQSCYYLAKWQREYNFQGIMSINVSPIQLKNPTFLFDLNSAIRRHNIDPRKIEIEITEGIFIDNIEDTVELLSRIKELGIGISLDDFGTGYSSLSYLQVLPLTTLKIDKSFIANISSEQSKEADITNAIVSLVTKMGLDTIAEGVENPEQLKVLEAINCKNIQGFLMGKPMGANLCERMLAGDESAVLRSENCTGSLLYTI